MTDNASVIAAHACAKVNLFLEVTGKRPDGCHDIDSVFVEIDFADTITAQSAATGAVTLACDDPSLPTDEDNLVVRAALALREKCGAGAAGKGIALRLAKQIPAGGGLGGGSSDAAATLRLANTLWRCGLSTEELLSLAETLGSDVPFFLHGGACRCRGRGEIITPLPAFPEDIEIGLAIPPVASSTAAAYRGLRLPSPGEALVADVFIETMRQGDAKAMRAAAFNRFEESVFRALPGLGALHAELETILGHSARMSGSGSVLWFFAEPGWRENAELADWARAKAVRLLPARAAKNSSSQ